jgi:hypothetical protein
MICVIVLRERELEIMVGDVKERTYMGELMQGKRSQFWTFYCIRPRGSGQRCLFSPILNGSILMFHINYESVVIDKTICAESGLKWGEG